MKKIYFNFLLIFLLGCSPGTQEFKGHLKKAKANEVDGLFQTAYAYHTGKGIEQNDQAAIYWYKRAAEQGSSGAYLNLGYLAEDGFSDEGPIQAMQYYKTAFQIAQTKDHRNQYRAAEAIGLAYMTDGNGIEIDFDKAIHYLEIAVSGGFGVEGLETAKLLKLDFDKTHRKNPSYEAPKTPNENIYLEDFKIRHHARNKEQAEDQKKQAMQSHLSEMRVTCQMAIEDTALYGAKFSFLGRIPFKEDCIQSSMRCEYRWDRDQLKIKNAYGTWDKSSAKCFTLNDEIVSLTVDGVKLR